MAVWLLLLLLLLLVVVAVVLVVVVLFAVRPDAPQISGDIRLTPFYDALEVVKRVNGYIADINANITDLPTRGACVRVPVFVCALHVCRAVGCC
jgi:hypothetical protein